MLLGFLLHCDICIGAFVRVSHPFICILFPFIKSLTYKNKKIKNKNTFVITNMGFELNLPS